MAPNLSWLLAVELSLRLEPRTRTRRWETMGGKFPSAVACFPRTMRLILPLLLAACAGSTPATRLDEARLASTSTAAVESVEERKIARTSRVRGGIEIDGRLDDPAWGDAEVHAGFWQREPDEGAPPRFPTQFRVVYDNSSVYIGVRAFDDQPGRIVRRLTRRDEDSSSDWIYVSIDSYHDRRTAFVFGLNAAGVQRDLLMFNDVQSDVSWNAVWEGGARVDPEGWVAEFRIPLSQLRFSGAPDQTWGFQVSRFVQRINERTFWSPRPREAAQEVSLYGDLRGLRELQPPGRFELLPYGSIGAAIAETDPGDPLNNSGEALAAAGLDFKIGLGSNTTVAGAINPDFGQVEADPSQVNLSANEIFFAEKRPFFLEGTDIFGFWISTNDGGNAPRLFYSRRIGAAPHASAAGLGVYHREPTATTILGAVKLSGKTSSGWSFGVLEALTAPETGRYIDAAGERHEAAIEPLTNYSVVRVNKDLNEGRTSVGAAVTGVHRALDETGLDDLRDQAYSGGLELKHRFGDDAYNLELSLFGSHVRGDPLAIDATQRASQRYFQRPDADHLDYDPIRESLSGFGAAGALGKWSKGNWRYGTGFDTMSPGLELNDLGYQVEADFHSHWVWGQYWDGEAGDYVRDWQVNSAAWGRWNHGGDHLARGINFNGAATLTSYWGGNLGFEIADILQSSTDLRGGPMLARDPVTSVWGGMFSDGRRQLTVRLGFFGFWAPANGSRGGSIDPSVGWTPRPNLSLSVGPSLGYTINDNQYVTEAIDASGQPHYVMARLRQVTTALTFRAGYTVSPTLSLQLYAQPFVSTGAFDEVKEVVDPGAAEYGDRYHIYNDGEINEMDGEISIDRDGVAGPDFSFGRPDFSFGQLRSTVVGRWEYRPGSTLFAIWSHGRTAEGPEGRFSLAEDYGNLAGEGGEHVFLLKLNYWLGG